ncbi:MAG: 4-hydroxybenzoate octaprenyltransferase [Alphaproteobacteria bacterium]
MSADKKTPDATAARSLPADSAADHSDIVRHSLLIRLTPAGLHPWLVLARLDRPIGIWLLYIPCLWGIGLAGIALPGGLDLGSALRLALLLAVGAMVMRSAGCTFNDIVDRHIDRRVARTADRPVASGRISVPAAVVFLGLQLAAGLAVLVSLPASAIWVGLGAVPLVFLYPLMKRITYWPQAFLGLTFNWGVLVGWAAVAGLPGTDLPGMAVLALYGGAIAWTIGYDTIYAYQDREDDALIGVKSTALLFGQATRRWLYLLYATAVGGFSLAAWLAGAGLATYGGITAMGLLLLRQAAAVDLESATSCRAMFLANRLAGLALAAGLWLDWMAA